MKPKHILLICIVAAGAFYGGIKGYVYYRVSSELDKMISMASPFVDISYGGISSSLDGSVAVENVRVLPQGVSDSVTVDAIEVRGDGPLFLYQLTSGFKGDGLPKNMSFALRGFRLPLDGEVAAKYSGFMLNSEKVAGAPQDGCGVNGGFSPELLGALGVDALMIDMSMGYRFDEMDDQSQITMEFDFREFETMEVDMTFAGMPQPGVVMMGGTPAFKKLALRYWLDPDFAAKAMGHCAKKRGQTVEAYIDSLFEGDDDQLAQAMGFIPGEGIREAMKRYLKEPGEVYISIRPPASGDFGSLAFYKPEDAVALLDPFVQVNGEAVSDLSFKIPERPGGMGPFGQLSGSDKTASSGGASSTSSSKKARPKPRFIQTAVGKLGEHIGRDVRIYTNQTDTVRKGILVSIEGPDVNIEQRLYGGKMSVHVPLRVITKAEVYRYPDEGS